MKRLLFPLAFLFCLGFSAAAQAQEASKAVITDFDQPRQARAIVEVIAKEFGINLAYDDELPNTAMYQGKLTIEDPAQGINNVLEKVGFTANRDADDENMIHIKTSATLARPTVRQITIPSGSLGGFAARQMAGRPQVVDPPPVQTPIYEQASPAYGSVLGGQNAYYGGYYNYGQLEHEYVQRAIDRDTWGALKFKKGREMFMENVEVYGCGKLIIQADEANNVYDHSMLVPVNCSPLTFRYSDGHADWEVEINEMIIPLRLQKTKDITLNQAFFDRARQRTSHLLYDFVEQSDGSLKKVPR